MTADTAQLIGQEMMGAGAPSPLIVLTTFVGDRRHMLYSTSVEPYGGTRPVRWQLGLADLLSGGAEAPAVEQ